MLSSLQAPAVALLEELVLMALAREQLVTVIKACLEKSKYDLVNFQL